MRAIFVFSGIAKAASSEAHRLRAVNPGPSAPGKAAPPTVTVARRFPAGRNGRTARLYRRLRLHMYLDG
jgi:hypothetical protein